MFKCKEKIAPKVFHLLFTLTPENKYTTRSTGIIVEPFNKTKFSEFTISSRGPHLWNKLIASNGNLYNHDSFSTFKNKVRTSLLGIEDILRYF